MQVNFGDSMIPMVHFVLKGNFKEKLYRYLIAILSLYFNKDIKLGFNNYAINRQIQQSINVNITRFYKYLTPQQKGTT